MILRWKALVKLATVALKALPTHHPAITPEFLAAICVVESGGDTFAVGDHGAAVGIAQFHPPTFYRFAERGSGDSRRSAPCSMLALVHECSHAMRRRYDVAIVNHRRFLMRVAANYHNSGRLTGRESAYVRRVFAVMAEHAKGKR